VSYEALLELLSPTLYSASNFKFRFICTKSQDVEILLNAVQRTVTVNPNNMRYNANKTRLTN